MLRSFETDRKSRSRSARNWRSKSGRLNAAATTRTKASRSFQKRRELWPAADASMKERRRKCNKGCSFEQGYTFFRRKHIPVSQISSRIGQRSDIPRDEELERKKKSKFRPVRAVTPDLNRSIPRVNDYFQGSNN